MSDNKAKSWKTIGSKILLDHDKLTVLENRVLLPNDKEDTYVMIAPNREDSVIIIAINSKNELILQKEYSYPPDQIMWQLPGGSMNKGESVEQAAKRELAEESGYGAKKTIVLGYYYTQNRLSNQKQFVVLCTDIYDYKLDEDADEFIETYWLSKKKITAMIKTRDINNINTLAALNIWFYS